VYKATEMNRTKMNYNFSSVYTVVHKNVPLLFFE